MAYNGTTIPTGRDNTYSPDEVTRPIRSGDVIPVIPDIEPYEGPPIPFITVNIEVTEEDLIRVWQIYADLSCNINGVWVVRGFCTEGSYAAYENYYEDFENSYPEGSLLILSDCWENGVIQCSGYWFPSPSWDRAVIDYIYYITITEEEDGGEGSNVHYEVKACTNCVFDEETEGFALIDPTKPVIITLSLFPSDADTTEEP